MAILAPYLHAILFVNISASPEASLREHKFHFVLYASRLHHRHQRVKNISWLPKDLFIFFICFVIAATVTCSLQRIRQTHVTSLLTCTGNHSQSWFPIIKLLWEVTDSNAGLGNYLTWRTDRNKWTGCLDAAVLLSHMTVWKFCCPKSLVSSECVVVMHQPLAQGFLSQAWYGILCFAAFMCYVYCWHKSLHWNWQGY